ncbi:AAA family ATPase [Priestia megaterium]|uniref:AAA family ATPase n=1 Tax=Priestia megaterium TaxID=1404 RepID=UPI002E1D8619|nr:AAA family ATPase [Priestia megaterium]
MLKISLCNYIAGAGKDSVADYLVEKHGFQKVSLSEGIYEIAYEYYGIPRGTKPPRELLHHIAESLRKYDVMLWIKNTLRKVEEMGVDRVVISDTRKLIEYAYLEEMGWNNVMVYCDPKVALERIEKRDGVSSEDNEELLMNSKLENQLRPLKDYMKTFDNSDDFEEVKKEVDAYIKFLEASS